MSVCIDKLPHSCGTSQGLQVFADEESGKVNGWCFSCATFVKDPYGTPKTVDEVDIPEPKSEAEIQAEMAMVAGLPTVDVRKRKLRGKYLQEFGTKTSLSEEDGKTPTAMYHPITKDGRVSGYYVKTLSEPSHEWAIGDVKDGDPFGWAEASVSGAYRLVITEGREDAIAVKALVDMYGDDKFVPAVISLANGTNSVNRGLARVSEQIRRMFREVVIVFDDDEPGHKAVIDAMMLFPKALSVTLPANDPNACLMEGVGKAAFTALAYGASAPKNTRLIQSGAEIHNRARKPTPYGELTWPFDTMNKVMRNIRTGETIWIGAGVKMGKSELLDAVVSHFIKVHDIKCFVAKPEEDNEHTYKLVCGKLVGHNFVDPDIPFDFDAYDKAGEILGDKLYMVDLYQHLGWESLKKDITIAAAAGCKAIFIDPITNLTNGMSASETNTHLEKIAQDLASMAMDLDVVIFVFVHLKAHDGNISKEQRFAKYAKGQYTQLGNCPHELGGDIFSMQFTGSRAMMRSCHLMLGLEGNKDPELDATIRSQRWLKILEDRRFGNSELIPLYRDPNTTLYQEITSV